MAALSGQAIQQDSTGHFGLQRELLNRNIPLNRSESNKHSERNQVMNRDLSELRRRHLKGQSDNEEPKNKGQLEDSVDVNCGSTSSPTTLIATDKYPSEERTPANTESDNRNTTDVSSMRPNNLSRISPKIENMSVPIQSGTSSTDVSPPSRSLVATAKSVKKSPPRRTETSISTTYPDLNGEELHLYVLSKIFNLKVVSIHKLIGRVLFSHGCQISK